MSWRLEADLQVLEADLQELEAEFQELWAKLQVQGVAQQELGAGQQEPEDSKQVYELMVVDWSDVNYPLTRRDRHLKQKSLNYPEKSVDQLISKTSSLVSITLGSYLETVKCD